LDLLLLLLLVLVLDCGVVVNLAMALGGVVQRERALLRVVVVVVIVARTFGWSVRRSQSVDIRNDRVYPPCDWSRNRSRRGFGDDSGDQIATVK